MSFASPLSILQPFDRPALGQLTATVAATAVRLVVATRDTTRAADRLTETEHRWPATTAQGEQV